MTQTMPRAQLVAELAEEMSVKKKTARAALDALSVIIAREVVEGGAVALPHVGKIFCQTRPARTVTDPETGETATREPTRIVKLAAAKAMKDRLAGA